mgnify:CR=1 FL=1
MRLPENKKKILISIDPGSAKSGIAVVNYDKTVIERKVIPSGDLEEALKRYIELFSPDVIIIGDGTSSRKIKLLLEECTKNMPLITVNEKFTTEKARMRYFKENPPRGFWKLIPVTLQVPKVPVDDLAAVIMAEEYIDGEGTLPE